MNNLRFHVGHATTSTCTVMYSVLADTDVSISIDAAAVDSGRSERRNSGGITIYTGSFAISGLTANKLYTFTLSQGAESYSGSFRTLPESGPFSFIFATCTNYRYRGPSVYRAMRKYIENGKSAPCIGILHCDDICYVDTLSPGLGTDGNYASPHVLTGSTGYPENTGLGADYATGWAVWHGHEPAYGSLYDDDYQWCLRNASWRMSGGDHAVANNHRRGQVGASDYTFVNATHEATALAEYAAFIGDGNPPTLGSAGDLYWGFECADLRLAVMDELKTADPVAAGGTNKTDPKETHPFFGVTQINNVMNYLDVANPKFKLLMLPTGYSVAGQPWAEWWQDEADWWHANKLTGDNLDGTSGWFFGLIGDNHTVHATKLDGGAGTGFWYFCPGTTGNSAATAISEGAHNQASIGTKTGSTRYIKAVDAGGANGAVKIESFLYVTVSSGGINVKCIESCGNVSYEYSLTPAAGNDNQWQDSRSQKFSY